MAPAGERASVTSSYLPCGQVSRRPGGITQYVHSRHGLKYLQCRLHVKYVPWYSNSRRLLLGKITGILSFPLLSISRSKKKKKKKSKITSFPSLSWEEQPAHPELGLPCPGEKLNASLHVSDVV